MIIAGIDPGASGALAIDFGDGYVECLDVPRAKINGKERVLPKEWYSSWSIALGLTSVDLIAIELVGAMPKQGVTSMFNFGQSLGFAHAIACGTNARIVFVPPAVWMRKLGLLNSSKDASREKFRALWPKHIDLVSRVKDHGRAEAALLAHYGRNFL